MKKLIATIIAIVAILAMSAPALADTVDTSVALQNSGTVGPYIKVLTMTPDDCDGAENGINVLPAHPIPSDSTYFNPPDVDGWELINFYIEIAPNGNEMDDISQIVIDVDYPSSDALEAAGYEEYGDEGIYGDRGDANKINLVAYRNGDGSWGDVNETYGFASTFKYPDGTLSTPPESTVRQLLAGQTSDWVDVNADGINNDATGWVSFLNNPESTLWWGQVPDNGPVTLEDAIAEYTDNQALVLEITAYLWFHQPGVSYNVSGQAYVGSTPSATVMGDFNLVKEVSCYTDFDAVTYPFVVEGGTAIADGDFDLATKGPDELTIWNNGNAPAQVAVAATKMVLDGNPDFYDNDNKSIDHFDARLYYHSLKTGFNVHVGWIEYWADQYEPTVISKTGDDHQQVGPTGPILLEACRPAKIQFSVHPDKPEVGNLVVGEYSGSICIICQPYTGCQLEVE